MRIRTGPVVPLLLLTAFVAGTSSAKGEPLQSSPLPEDEPPVFGVESSVVLVDVVVRDKRGRAVRDLEASDFTLYEDGERQELQSFRVVSGGRPGPNRLLTMEPGASAVDEVETAASPATPPAADGETVPSVIVFVFDRLSPNARNIARRASQAYLERGHVDGDLVAIFGIDLALHVLQPFTQRLNLIERGFDRALMQANTAFASTRGQARDALERLAQNQDSATALSASGLSATAGDATGAYAASLAVQMAFDQIEANMARSFDALERDQQGFASTNGLMAVVEGLRQVPGRKTLIFFSEGLAMPSSVLAQFRSVIATANRAQVSVYAIDSGGLRTESETRETRDELMTHAQSRVRQEASGGIFGSPALPMTRALERNEDMLRLNPHAGLGQLAEETGGFLVADTNDLSEGFGHIQEDMRFHYVLAYTPSDPRYDGRFRTIAVDVSRPNVRVQSRKGYFAVPPDVVLPAQAPEAAALALLEEAAPRRDFPIWAKALSFPEPERPGHVAVLVQLAGSEVAWSEPAGEQEDYEADFSIVVRFKNAEGREMDRLSQRYLLSVPPRSFEAARGGDVLFFKETDLPAGRYAVEAVARDALSERGSVFRGRVEVSAASERDLCLSSLALVQRVEELPQQEQATSNPLVFGPTMLYPNLGAPFQKTSTPNLGFYFTAYGGGERPSPTEATIELLQAGHTLARLPTALPQPDERGRIQYAGALPIDSLPAGQFTLRVSVTDGASIATREAPFSVTQ